MSTPAIILIVLIAIGFGATTMRNRQATQVSLGAVMLRNAVLIGLLYWGGFFGKAIV
jgi:hypothetical protein